MGLNPLILNKRLETLSGTMPWMKRWAALDANATWELVVGVVIQFMQTPQKPHLDAMRCILRYIKHTL